MSKDSRKWEKKRYQRKARPDNQEDLPNTSNSFEGLNNQGKTSSEEKHMETNTNNSKSQDHMPLQSSTHLMES